MRTATASKGPSWLDSYGIAPGDWMTVVKSSSFKQFMGPDHPLKTNIDACLILHTQGFQGSELAITTAEDKGTRPITSSDIGREIWAVHRARYIDDGVLQTLQSKHEAAGLSKTAARKAASQDLEKAKPTRQNLRRGMAELEDTGRIERRRAKDDKPLREIALEAPEEARKLSGDKIHYYRWIVARPPGPGLMRRIYEEKVAENQASKVVSERLPFPPELVKDIRNAANLFRMEDSPFFHLSAETPQESIQDIEQSIGDARVTFRDSLQKKHPEAFVTEAPETEAALSLNLRMKNEAEIPPPIRYESEVVPPALPVVANLGAAVAEPGPLPALRAGLVQRGFTTIDATGIQAILSELGDAPLERYWVTLDDRLTRGNKFGFQVLKEIAKTARENYAAGQEQFEGKAPPPVPRKPLSVTEEGLRLWREEYGKRAS